MAERGMKRPERMEAHPKVGVSGKQEATFRPRSTSKKDPVPPTIAILENQMTLTSPGHLSNSPQALRKLVQPGTRRQFWHFDDYDSGRYAVAPDGRLVLCINVYWNRETPTPSVVRGICAPSASVRARARSLPVSTDFDTQDCASGTLARNRRNRGSRDDRLGCALKWFSRARMRYSVQQERTFPDPQESAPQKREVGWPVGHFQRSVVRRRRRRRSSQWSADSKPRSASTRLR
jgi:hypothetical protein